ncbi:hypothetical protein SYNPS1DRAFT_22763 [Syncephalis pseudoplumigaleata]|uniref:Uncharacterized protein n=1 Tax=Syncephalis pseudoplumigaleata TaxID=1712513 RepID=A0A4P9YZ69_9FUNG|nr:hypothetical protein SYNPS1DRAFT_22763 [Syncephalis pseudoplumigaleata]|eukprot:RKP25245.1 hypothetical protein SYNPS1DRAFT_22763 [Syncephalis pseudoplumigaleata]
MPNVSGGTIVMAASGPVHSNAGYPLHSPQQASFRHPLPSSGLSGRNRLNLTVHAPAYAEGQSILVSPRPPGTGGELMSIPVTVASAGPTTTSYPNATLRSSMVAMRTAAGPLPPKAKLTPRTPVGPEASRYRRPPMSATTAPPSEAAIMAGSAAMASSPRTDAHPRRTASSTQVPLISESVMTAQTGYDTAMLDRRADPEEGRRRFMAMMETMYERAFELSRSQSTEPSPRQQRLEALAEQLDQAGGLEALVKQRVAETLASILGGGRDAASKKSDDPSAMLATLVERIERLEERVGAKEAAAKAVMPHLQ